MRRKSTGRHDLRRDAGHIETDAAPPTGHFATRVVVACPQVSSCAARRVLLGPRHGRGHKSLAEQLAEMLAVQDELEARLQELQRKRQLRTTMLVCTECHYGSDRWADGWKAYLDGDGLVMFCPDCAELESAASRLGRLLTEGDPRVDLALGRHHHPRCVGCPWLLRPGTLH
jgi:hypothetical protein